MSLLQPLCLVLSLALALLWPAIAFAQPTGNLPTASDPATSVISDRTVSIDVEAGDLPAVVAMLGRQVGVKVSVFGVGKLYRQVYVHLDTASLAKALRTIAQSAGARVTQDENGAYVFSPLTAPLPLPATFPAPSAVGYRWHTLLLKNAKAGDILTWMHWAEATALPGSAPFEALPPGDLAPNLPALPEGVHHIYALQSTNALLVDATEIGFATITRLVKVLDSSPRQIEFHMLLVAVPQARADFYRPDMTADRLLPLLLAGKARVISVPTATVTDGTTARLSIACGSAPTIGGFRLVQAGPYITGGSTAGRCEVELTPRINTDGTLTLGLTFAGSPVPTSRNLQSDVMATYEVPSPQTGSGERLFFFLQPTLVGESSDSASAGSSGGQSVTVTP